MSGKLTVIVGHSAPEIRRLVSSALANQPDLQLVDTASTGAETLQKVMSRRPNLLLVDGAFTDLNSIQLITQVVQSAPRTGVIVLTTTQDFGFIRRVMQAGARSFAIPPFDAASILTTVREVAARIGPTLVEAGDLEPASKVIVAFGPKGGVGKTTITVNLAIALRQRTRATVALVDADYAFGDMHLSLNLKAPHSMVDFVEHKEEADLEFLHKTMVKHESGVRLLAAPPRPELAELITGEHVRLLKPLLTTSFEYVVVDAPVSYDERVLAWFDISHVILLVLTPEVGPIHNAVLFLELAKALGYGKDRVKIVLNRSNSQVGISSEDIERTLDYPITFTIPSGGRLVATSVNLGNPFVITNPEADVSRAINQIVDFAIKPL